MLTLRFNIRPTQRSHHSFRCLAQQHGGSLPVRISTPRFENMLVRFSVLRSVRRRCATSFHGMWAKRTKPQNCGRGMKNWWLRVGSRRHRPRPGKAALEPEADELVAPANCRYRRLADGHDVLVAQSAQTSIRIAICRWGSVSPRAQGLRESPAFSMPALGTSSRFARTQVRTPRIADQATLRFDRRVQHRQRQ